LIPSKPFILFAMETQLNELKQQLTKMTEALAGVITEQKVFHGEILNELKHIRDAQDKHEKKEHDKRINTIEHTLYGYGSEKGLSTEFELHRQINEQKWEAAEKKMAWLQGAIWVAGGAIGILTFLLNYLK